jgi:hypothetical protein
MGTGFEATRFQTAKSTFGICDFVLGEKSGFTAQAHRLQFLCAEPRLMNANEDLGNSLSSYSTKKWGTSDRTMERNGGLGLVITIDDSQATSALSNTDVTSRNDWNIELYTT